MDKEKKFYKRSNGEMIEISTMETTHLINGLSKKYRELFDSTSKKDFSNRLKEINDLKEDLYKRFNDFNEKLGDE